MQRQLHRQISQGSHEQITYQNKVKAQLSILIPTYNDDCLSLVEAIHRQAEAIGGLDYEIIVADDGSTDSAVIERNSLTEKLSHCLYIRRGSNTGRASIRNYLGRKASYGRLLFIDSDMAIVRDDYLRKYIETSGEIIYGGYCVMPGPRGNLRYEYEKACGPAHSVQMRKDNPWKDFHTSNFLIDASLFHGNPLDENYRHYGYEDVVYGRAMREQGVGIVHIDNPVGFCRYEDNRSFMDKTREGIRTLLHFRRELSGYSSLLKMADMLDGMHVSPVVRKLFGVFRKHIESNLYGTAPSLRLFQFYKLGYYLTIKSLAEKS